MAQSSPSRPNRHVEPVAYLPRLPHRFRRSAPRNCPRRTTKDRHLGTSSRTSALAGKCPENGGACKSQQALVRACGAASYPIHRHHVAYVHQWLPRALLCAARPTCVIAHGAGFPSSFAPLAAGTATVPSKPRPRRVGLYICGSNREIYQSAKAAAKAPYRQAMRPPRQSQAQCARP